MKNKSGITLIALIVTIIVMLILVTVTMVFSFSDNGVIGKAKEAEFQQDVSQYSDELQAFIGEYYYYDGGKTFRDIDGDERSLAEGIQKGDYYNRNENKDDLKECIPSYDYNKYDNSFYVKNNKLVYRDTGNKKEKKWAEGIGLAIDSRTVKIALKVDGEGEIQGITEMEFIANVGEKINLKAVPKTITLADKDIAFEFVKWMKDGECISNNPSQTITITDEAEYTAVFEPGETLIYYTQDSVEKIFTTSDAIIEGATFKNTIVDKTKITKVILGKNVTKISAGTFEGCSNLKSITIGDNVTIGDNKSTSPFLNCSNLETVTIGDNAEISSSNSVYGLFRGCTKLLSGVNDATVTVKSISNTLGYGGFTGTKALRGTVKINEGLTTIGECAFTGCTNLIGVSIPNSVTTIGKNAFNGCTNLISINISNSVTVIEQGALANCPNMKNDIVIAEGMSVYKGAFGSSGIKSVVVGNNIQIKEETFSGCKNLKSITIGDNVTIGEQKKVSPFLNCSNLESVTIGENAEIPDSNSVYGIFRGCTKLLSGANDATVTIKSISNTLGYGVFTGTKALRGTIKINEGLTTIGECAFSDCTNITDINIPNSVTTIEEKAFYRFSGTINIDKESNSILNSPWGATGATINWLR